MALNTALTTCALPQNIRDKGSLWIQLIRNYACQHGFRNISLQTKRNAPAYHFYQKTGFEEQEDRVCFSLDCLP